MNYDVFFTKLLLKDWPCIIINWNPFLSLNYNFIEQASLEKAFLNDSLQYFMFKTGCDKFQILHTVLKVATERSLQKGDVK